MEILKAILLLLFLAFFTACAVGEAVFDKYNRRKKEMEEEKKNRYRLHDGNYDEFLNEN